MSQQTPHPFIAIACGGTGGHLFPGIAVGEELVSRGCSVTLLISEKEVDQQAVKSARDMDVVTLPAVGLTRGNLIGFLGGFYRSYRGAKQLFSKQKPDAVLAMGGFTSAAPVLAGKSAGAKTFLHESNSIPGRANRWLARFVDDAFIYFPKASGRLRARSVHVIGMPVRSQFTEPVDAASARMALGLNPHDPLLFVMGGSQGASGINDLLIQSVPLLKQRLPKLQFLHLTGEKDVQKVQAAYTAAKCRAVVRPFLTEMEYALGAATVAVSRAGASSLAEIAAMRLPAIFVPYPHAADNHQYHNALEFVGAGAGRTLEQGTAKTEVFVSEIVELITNEKIRAEIQQALGRWHAADAAKQVAEKILARLERPVAVQGSNPAGSLPSHCDLGKGAKCST